MVHRRLGFAALLLVIIFVFPARTHARAEHPASAGDAAAYAQQLHAQLVARREATQDADVPRYDLSINVDPGRGRMSGSMTLEWRNQTGTTLPDAVLRLYPNFPPDVFGDGGDLRMDVSNVRANGVAVAAPLEAQGTAVRVPLPRPAAPGDTITIALDWNATMKPWDEQDGTQPLPSYYPMLAAWAGEWRADVTRFADRVFARAAIYRARITVPAGSTVIASGLTIGSQTANNTTTFDIVTGQVREFAFSVGRFAKATASHAGIAINVYHKPNDGLAEAARQVALHTAASLLVYNERFGAYPYAELDFHLINARRGYDIGVEYPGLIYLLINGRYTDNTRFVTAHEVAHQWWYGVVGNDIFNEPWIDEAFAQWSPLLVEEFWAGPAAAERVYQTQIVRLAQRTSLPCGLSIYQYGAWNTYYAAVYGRGAQFLVTLRRELGDAAFFAGLQRYYADNTYSIGTTAEVREALERSSGRNLGELFRSGVGR
jgi:aminopeptidase N